MEQLLQHKMAEMDDTPRLGDVLNNLIVAANSKLEQNVVNLSIVSGPTIPFPLLSHFRELEYTPQIKDMPKTFYLEVVRYASKDQSPIADETTVIFTIFLLREDEIAVHQATYRSDKGFDKAILTSLTSYTHAVCASKLIPPGIEEVETQSERNGYSISIPWGILDIPKGFIDELKKATG